MKDERDERETSRRDALRGLFGMAALGVTAGTATTATAASNVTVSMDNVGASAWEVTETEGTGGDVAPTDAENPTLTFESGVRYTVENGGWSAHPLAFLESGGYYGDTTLLSQRGGGEFDDDPDVNFVDEGDRFSFTLTEDLASRVDAYDCTVHASMRGSVETVAGGPATPDYDAPGGSLTIDAPADDARTPSPVTFEVSAEGFTVEPASAGVAPGAGHLHLLADRAAVDPGTMIPFEDGYNHYPSGTTTPELELDPGEYTVVLQAADANHVAYELTDSVDLTVPDTALTPFDQDATGRLDPGDVLDAITAYNAGRSVGGEPVTANRVLEVIVAFNEGRPV